MPADLGEESKRFAHLLIDTFGRELGVILKYDEKSLEYLDSYISRNKAEIRKQTGGSYGSLIEVIGSFLGECIITNFGGQWKQDDKGRWGVYLDEKNAVFPFAKVRKAFDADDECDSIAGFYRITQLLKEGKLGNL
jgi:hypothetical protein